METSRRVISPLALAVFVALTWLLWRALPRAAPGLPTIARLVLAPIVAWLLTATYTLPWYAAWAWSLLALVVASRWDDVMLAWMTTLTIAYIPGRDVRLSPPLAGITRWLRAGLGPGALAVVLVASVVVVLKAGRSADPMP